KALLTIKCEVESRSLQRKLQDAEYNVGHTQLIVERIRTQGASNADLLAWLTYNNEWKRIATIISASIDNIKTEYAVMIEAIGSGRKTLSNFSPVKVPETPLPPSMPPLPFNVATPDLPPSSINNLRSFAPSIPPPSQAIRPVTGTPPGLERQHFVQPQQELERPSSRGSSLTTTAAQPQKESSGAAGGSTAAGGGRDKLQKLIAEVKRKLPDVDEKTVTSAMGKLRKDKWNGALPKNMRVIIAEVVQYLTDASQSERTTAWVTAQAASSAPRDSRAILARGHECKICLMPCLNAQDLSACSACNEPYHRP
uniref:Uncharacterized protein n=1 Tax=Plectus sambesii TaxID=2011161 RepID=A0A914UTG0_9BILA